MFTTFVKYLIVFCTSFCGVVLAQSEVGQQAIKLGYGCYPLYFGYAITPQNCTCIKTNSQSPGLVQWVFTNGTLPKQVSDPQNLSSILIVEPPYKYALNQTYTCRLEVGPGQSTAELSYSVNFLFGPEYGSLQPAQVPREPIYLCPRNETKELKMYCDVPSATVNPRPVYTCFIDDRRYGGYDKLGGQPLEEPKVWRLELVFKLNSPGNHTVRCEVRNEFASFIWFTLIRNILVSDQPPPPSYQC